jgi:hypothetical protein
MAPDSLHANGLSAAELDPNRYSPHEHRPLAAYAGLTGVFGAGVAGALVALRAAGRELPEHPAGSDIVLLGLATHKLSRTITKDKSTSFLRAPFTRFEKKTGHAEVSEEPRGHGAQLVIGELLVCPYCLAQWVAAGLSLSLLASPRMTRYLAGTFASVTISDFLQLAYKAAEDHV